MSKILAGTVLFVLLFVAPIAVSVAMGWGWFVGPLVLGFLGLMGVFVLADDSYPYVHAAEEDIAGTICLALSIWSLLALILHAIALAISWSVLVTLGVIVGGVLALGLVIVVVYWCVKILASGREAE